MKSFLKKFIVILSVAAILFNFSFVASAEADPTTAEAVRFGSDGKLRIMHVTDTHLEADNVDDVTWLIGEACDREKPEIVMLTGDIAMDYTVEETFRLITLLMQVFEERNIPVAVCFGNHDSESGIISREGLMEFYNTFDCSISIDDGELLTGCGTYNVPVLGSKDDTVKFNLWVFDSGDYDGEGHYANVSEDQVEWYVQKSKQLEQDNGQKINSLAFQHIIVPEIYDALKQTKFVGAYTVSRIYHKSELYRFDPDRVNYGFLREHPCPGYYNHGQFEAMVDRGDVLAMFTGHDHTNAFGVRYKDIDIVNSLSTRYNGDSFSTQYGYRMLIVDENDTETYQTKVVHWYDFFSRNDVKALKADNDEHVKTAREIRFLGFFQKFFQNIAVFFVQTFTGRTVRYPD